MRSRRIVQGPTARLPSWHMADEPTHAIYGEAELTAQFSVTATGEVTRVLDSLRLTVLGLLLGIGLTVGLGIGVGIGGLAGAIIGTLSAVAVLALVIGLCRWQRSRSWLAERADWIVRR